MSVAVFVLIGLFARGSVLRSQLCCVNKTLDSTLASAFAHRGGHVARGFALQIAQKCMAHFFGGCCLFLGEFCCVVRLGAIVLARSAGSVACFLDVGIVLMLLT